MLKADGRQGRKIENVGHLVSHDMLAVCPSRGRPSVELCLRPPPRAAQRSRLTDLCIRIPCAQSWTASYCMLCVQNASPGRMCARIHAHNPLKVRSMLLLRYHKRGTFKYPKFLWGAAGVANKRAATPSHPIYIRPCECSYLVFLELSIRIP